MAHKVTIDVETRFVDNLTDEAKAASQSIKQVEKAAESAQAEVSELGKQKVTPKVSADTSEAQKKLKLTEDKMSDVGKKKVKPKLEADDSDVAKKLFDTDRKISKFGRTRAEASLAAMDKASERIERAARRAKAFEDTYVAAMKVKDSNVLKTLNNASNKLKSLTSKAWSIAIKVPSTVLSPLKALKNTLFNIKTLITGIAAAWTASKVFGGAISVADAYSSAKISFSTLLGESQGQQMMDNLDDFAKATPFNTTNVIENAQKMLAMGWDAENIIDDMEIIGNAAAATGKLDVGLESIVRALSQIKTKGKLSTEELNQLAEAGISAKAMLAEQLGYGTGDTGIAKMTEDLEDGKIASDQAIAALLNGMRKYDGMMDSMANETVEGLISQLGDAFNINVVRRWGQGLQDGAKRGLGTLIGLLDDAEGALEKVGDIVYELGAELSNWAADKLESAMKRITEITDSYEFQNADLGGKISMLWNGVVVDPLKEWWENGGRAKTAETAGEIGEWLGKTLTEGLLMIFGMTDILDDEKADELGKSGGMSIAQSFAQGFKENFDGSAITDAFVDAIGDVWNALPTWAKLLLGGYAVGKIAGGISSIAGGIGSFIGTAATAGAGDTIIAGTGLRGLIGGNVVNAAGDVIGATGLRGLIGSTGNAMVSGTGILGKLASAGYAMTGGPASAGAYFGAGMSGGTAALIGGAGIAGGLAAGASLIKGGMDLYRGYTTDDEVEAKASKASGWTAIGGVGAGAAAGAAIGSIIPGLGTLVGGLIGAGIGGIAGWVGGNAWADEIRKTDDAINDVTAAVEDLETEEEKLEAKNKLVWQNIQDHFGDVKLSLSEIQRLTDQIVWGDDMGKYEQFSSAVQQAEASLSTMKESAEATNKWMWKASLGVDFNEDEIESIAASFDQYIASAQSYLDNKHYEFTTAVSLLVDVESETGKSIVDTGNEFYGKYKADLEAAGKELGDLLTNSIADGFINAEEHEAIVAAQKKIAEITQKIADAETTAELELIKVKFGGGKLDPDSFDAFMEQMGTTLSERVAANDEAFKASVSTLQLELSEGAITQEQYDQQIQALMAGYTGKVDDLKARIMNVELEIIGDAYAVDGVTSEKLAKALQDSLAQGIDPIDWTTEQAREFLGLDQLSESSAGALARMLGGVADQLQIVEVDGKLLLDLGIETEGDPVEEITETIPETVEETVGVNITGEKNILNTIDVLVEDFEVPEDKAATVALLLTGDKEILSQIDTSALATELGVPESVAETIITKLSGSKSIEERVNVLSTDLVDATEVWQTITVNLKAKVGKVINTLSGFFNKGKEEDDDGSGYRGGIFGGDSALDAFARGGSTDNGGIVGGSTRFIRVNEESPEMIIPLSSQRRQRALKLWMKTGEMLDVPGFSRGGRTSGNTDEGIRFHGYGSDEATGGQTVQIEVGGITVEIHVDARGSENISEAIERQKEEIAETIAGIMADAFSGQFANTPVRGGAA